MALLAPDIFFLLLFLLFKAIPSQGQTLQQLILNPGFSTLSSHGPSANLPSNGLSKLSSSGLSFGTSPSNILSSLSSVLLPPNGLSIQAAPQNFITSGIPTSQSLISQPGLPALTIAPPSSGSCSLHPPSTKGTITDNEVLNNMAIALQLLILSNLLNSSPSDVESGDGRSSFAPAEFSPPSSIYTVSYASSSSPLPLSPTSPPPKPASYYQLPLQASAQQPTYYQRPPSTAPTVIQNPTQYYHSYETSPTVECQPPPVMPNANFVGSASYGDGSNVLTTFAGPFGSSKAPTKPPRTSLSLMSPYDAISSTSPYSDPILTSPYGSIMTSAKDFKSPYATFDTSSDFF